MATPLVQYLFNEATSGTSPTSILDTGSGTPLNLTPTYTGTAAWSSVASGSGLTYGTDENTGCLSSIASGTKLATLNGATQMTWELVIDYIGASHNSNLCDVTDTSTTQICGLWSGNGGGGNGTRWEIWCDVADPDYAFSLTPPTGLTVVHIVYDSTQATAGNRVKVYYNGVQQALTANTTIPQNRGLVVVANSRVVLGAPNVAFSSRATYYYTALYSSALTGSEISANAAALAANNDANPNAAAPASYTRALAPMPILRQRRSVLSVVPPVMLAGTGYLLARQAGAGIAPITATAAASIESDFTVTSAGTETLTGTVAASIDVDFVVSAAAAEAITGTSAFAFTNDFTVAGTSAETFASTAACSIDADFSAAASSNVANPISAAVTASIDADFSVTATGAETFDGAEASSIESDFTVAASSTVANPGGATVAVSIETDFVVAAAGTETIPSTASAVLTDDFVVTAAGASLSGVDASVAVAFTNDFTVAVSSGVINPVTATAAAAFTDDFVVAVASAETIAGTAAASLENDFTVTASSDVVNPVTSTATAAFTNDFVVAASGSSLSMGDLTVVAAVTNDFTVAATAAQTITGASSFDIAGDFSPAALLLLEVTAIGASAVANDFSASAAVTEADTASVTATVDDLFVVAASVSASNDTGSNIAAVVTNDFTVSVAAMSISNIDGTAALDIASLFIPALYIQAGATYAAPTANESRVAVVSRRRGRMARTLR